MASLTRAIGAMATYTVVVILYLGAFSRLTHGVYTRSFYEYQLDRAPDNASTRLIPCVDTALATLALVRATRSYALFFCVAFQVVGLGLRLREGKDVMPDATRTLATAVALATSIMGDIKAARR